MNNLEKNNEALKSLAVDTARYVPKKKRKCKIPEGTIIYCPALERMLCADGDLVNILLFPNDYYMAPPAETNFSKLIKSALQLALQWIEEPVHNAILTWYGHFPKSVEFRFDVIEAALVRTKLYLSQFHKELIIDYENYRSQIRKDIRLFQNDIEFDKEEHGYFELEYLNPVKVKESLTIFVEWLSALALMKSNQEKTKKENEGCIPTNPDSKTKNGDEQSFPLSLSQWAKIFSVSRPTLNKMRKEGIYHFKQTSPRKWTLPKKEIPTEYLEKYGRAEH